MPTCFDTDRRSFTSSTLDLVTSELDRTSRVKIWGMNSALVPRSKIWWGQTRTPSRRFRYYLNVGHFPLKYFVTYALVYGVYVCVRVCRPLHCAVAGNHVTIVRELLRCGADVTKLNGGKRSVLQLAKGRAVRQLIHGITVPRLHFDSYTVSDNLFVLVSAKYKKVKSVQGRNYHACFGC